MAAKYKLESSDVAGIQTLQYPHSVAYNPELVASNGRVVLQDPVPCNSQESEGDIPLGDGELQEIDINIKNVVCSFSVHCHINLRKLATEGVSVEFRRELGMVSMRLRQPAITASIWSSGKITCTGATSNDDAHLGARRVARRLQNMGFKCHFKNYRVVNVLATCFLPFSIKVMEFSRAHSDACMYEPEIHPGATYKLADPKATLKIFTTGSLTITAPKTDNIASAVDMLYPMLEEYRMEDVIIDGRLQQPQLPHRFREKNRRKRTYEEYTAHDWEQLDDEFSGSDYSYDSDSS